MPIPKTPSIQVGKSAPKVKEKRSKAVPEKEAKSKIRKEGATVYDMQPLIEERELNRFVELLPKFRTWATNNGEEAHPILTGDGRPDFLYSPSSAAWVRNHNFDAARFFCIMGKMAAGLVIVEEGNDFKGTRPPDMPPVASSELELVRKHLGELLSAGGAPVPIR